LTPRNLLLALIVCTAAALPLAASPQNAEHGTFDFGFEQRVRNENWDNVFDFNSSTDDQRNQVRYRTRAWAKAPITSNIDVYAGLMQETNQIVVKRAPYRFDEVAFENLYVDFKKFLVKGLSLRVGRQNLTKGEGFLVFEGNPWDGSRSIYFNAVNLAYTWKKSQLEVIGILNPYRDRFLPRIHDKSRQLVEWDEQALGAYYTDKNHKDTTFEAYYFYKKEVHDRRSPINAQFQPDRHINTAGSRVARKLKHDWDAAGEFALQWGAQHPSTSLAGWAGYGYVKKSWKQAPWKPSLQGGYWAFSGDNPTSGSKNEGWDPLFSRWPKWSELYIYSQLRERGVGYWTNEGMWQAEMQFAPTKLLGGRLTYYHMDSFHRFPGAPQIYGMGTDRGNHYQARLDVNVNKYWKGHVLYERHQPGDFYTGHSPAYFLRFEVIFNVKASIAHS
jgi:hypothetical protein